MAETLKTIWVVERRTDVSDWLPFFVLYSREEARRQVEMYNTHAEVGGTGWRYRAIKYLRARA